MSRLVIVFCVLFFVFCQTQNTKHKIENTKHETQNTKQKTRNTLADAVSEMRIGVEDFSTASGLETACHKGRWRKDSCQVAFG